MSIQAQAKVQRPGWDPVSNSFHFYRPKPKQEAFHASKAKFKAMIGAFRSGKTYAACYEVIQHCLAFPGNRWLICRKDYTTLRDSTMQTFFEILPKRCGMVQKWNETTHDLLLKTNGEPSLIMFRGAEDYLQFGSYELGGFLIDQAEQVPEAVFRMLSSRLSRPGVKHCGIITPNPPNQYHWIYRTFKRDFDPARHFVVHTSTYDNKEYLPEDYIAELEKQPESWKKMYLYGEYGFMAEGDPVYAGFRSEVNMAKEPLEIVRGLPIIRMIDFGYRFPACGWYQILSAKDRVHKLAEFIGENITADAFADQVLRISLERFPGAKFEIGGDPAGHQKSDKSEQTSVEILVAKGLIRHAGEFKSKPTYIKDGLNLVRRELQVRDDGLPGFVIDPSCRVTEEAYLGGYYLREGSDEPNRDCHPYIDVADTDRYLFVNYVPIQKLEKRRVCEQPKIKRHSATGY